MIEHTFYKKNPNRKNAHSIFINSNEKSRIRAQCNFLFPGAVKETQKQHHPSG